MDRRGKKGRSENSRHAELQESVSRLRAAGAEEVSNLITDVEDLVGRIGDAADPEIARLRAKVEQGVATARKSLAQGAEQVQRKAHDAMEAGDEYVHDEPWKAIGVAALAGLVAGLMVNRRRGSGNHRESRRH
jgi:ElaB/YqjD/DUF883 family membrane-anchored ribosome-binding protein